MSASANMPVLQQHHMFGLTGEDHANSIIYSREDTVMYSIGRYLCFHNTESKQQKLILPNESCKKIVSFCVSYGNRYIAVCEQQEVGDKRTDVGIYKLANMKKVRTLVANECFNPTVCSFSKNGKYLVTCGSDDEGTVLMWDWDKVKVLGMGKLGETPIRRAQVNPYMPEAVLVSGSRSLKVFRMTETSAASTGQSNVAAMSAAMSLTSTVALPGSLMTNSNNNLVNGYPVMASFSPNFMGVINDHVWLSPTHYMVASTDSTLRIFDGRSEIRKIENLFPEGHSIRCIKSLSTGGLLACGDRGYFSIIQAQKQRDSRAKDVRTRLKEAEEKDKKNAPVSKDAKENTIGATLQEINLLSETRRMRTVARETILGCALSQSEDFVCFFEESQTLVQFNLSEVDLAREEEGARTAVVAQAHRGRINVIDMAVHRPVAVTASFDCSVRVWDVNTKTQLILRVFPEEPLSAAVHPSGNLLVVSFRRKLVFYAITVSDLVQVCELDCKGCKTMRFAHGGHILACISGTSLWLVSSVTFQVIHCLRGHIGPVRAISWSRDDARIATAGYDGAVYEWDVLTGRKVQEHIDKSIQFTGVAFCGSRTADISQGPKVVAQQQQPSNHDFSETLDRGRSSVHSTAGLDDSSISPPSAIVSSTSPRDTVMSARGLASTHLAPSILVACGLGRDTSVIRRIVNGIGVDEISVSDLQFTRVSSLDSISAIMVGCHTGALLILPLHPVTAAFVTDSRISDAEAQDDVAVPMTSEEITSLSAMSGIRRPTFVTAMQVLASKRIAHHFHVAHSDGIRSVTISHADQYLLTGGEDGALAIHVLFQPTSALQSAVNAVSASHMQQDAGLEKDKDKDKELGVVASTQPLDPKVLAKFDTLTMVLRSEFAESQSRIQDLEEQVVKVRQELTIKLREREKELLDEARDARTQYDRELERKSAEMDALRIARVDVEADAKRKVEHLQTAHLNLRTELENAYELKLMAAHTALAQLKDAKEDERVKYEDMLTAVHTDHANSMEDVRRHYEQQLRDAADQHRQLQDDLDYLRREHNAETHAMFNEQMAAMESVHEDARRDLDKQKELASGLKSEAVYMRNKFAQNRQEAENLRSVLRQRDSSLAAAERQISELQTTCSSLRREVHQRDESLVDKERLINELKKRTQELEKFRFVLGSKLHALRAEMEPKDTQIDALLSQVHEMEAEFEREGQDKSTMEAGMRDRQAAVDSLTRELRLSASRDKEKERYIRMFRTELGRAVQGADSADWKESIRALYRKFVLSEAPWEASSGGGAAGKDAMQRREEEELEKAAEWDRQRKFLESHKSAMVRKAAMQETMGADNAKRKLRENHALMEEVNSLRRANHELSVQLKQVQSELRMQALTTIAETGNVSRAGSVAINRPTSQAQTEYGARPSSGARSKSRGKLVRGSTVHSQGPTSPIAANAGRQAAANSASIAGLLEQMENNNRLIEMQRFEIKRLREQVQYLLEKTKQYVTIPNFEEEFSVASTSLTMQDSRSQQATPTSVQVSGESGTLSSKLPQLQSGLTRAPAVANLEL